VIAGLTGAGFGYTLYIRKDAAMKVKISKWGNSLAVRLPKAAVEAAGLAEGSEVEVTVEGGELRLRQPVPFRRYRLEDLLAEMDRLGPENEPETVNWGPDRGSEIIDDAYSRGEITLEDILNRQPASKSRKRKNEPLRKPTTDAPRRRRHRLG
jgi:antitoxin MazE